MMKNGLPRSRFEANVLGQEALVRAALEAPAPSWMKPPVGRKVFFVGVGTNHHAARLAAWLWSRAGFDARAVHSYDFVARPYRLSRGDLAIFLSHRGGKSYTVTAEARARRDGAETVIVTGEGSPWTSSPRRLVTGPMEDTGAFTQSFTTTMAWLLRWPRKPSLVAPFKRIPRSLRWGPAFPRVRPGDDVVLLGDGLREWVACEVALKLQEAAYLRARSFGLEEFIHGPRVSVGAGSVVIGFSGPKEKRWDTVRRYLKMIEVPFVEVRSEDWLAQVIWGQRFTVDACRRLGIDPDLLRTDDPRYRRARERLGLSPGRPVAVTKPQQERDAASMGSDGKRPLSFPMPFRVVEPPILERRAADRCLNAQLAIMRVLADSPSVTEATTKLIRTACEDLDWDVGAIWEVDATGRRLVCLDLWRQHMPGLSGFELSSRRHAIPMGTGLPGLVWASGEPAWIADVSAHRDGTRNAAAAKVGLRSHFAFPIRLGRKVFGVMEFFSRQVRQPDYALLQMMAITGSQIGQFLYQKRVEESLHESHEKYRLLFSGVSDAIVLYEAATGRISDANEAALRLYGCTREEILRLSLEDLSAEVNPPPEAPDGAENGVQRISVRLQRRKDGAVFPAEVTGGTFKWKDTVMGIRVERDITERRRAEEAEKLRHSERMQREFVATVSHELRTPVAAIQGFAQTLLQGGLADARHRTTFVKIIEKQAKRLGRLVEDLLELSAMESGKKALRPERVPMAKFVRKFGRGIAPLFKRKRLSLRVDISDDVRASVDPNQLAQVLQNLLSNAIKFSRRGGRIQVTGRRLPHSVALSVRDQGVGIPEEYLPTIFDRFNQARKDRSVGTGLGLSIAKQIVEAHGGRIWAESVKGRGATFHFTLPRAD